MPKPKNTPNRSAAQIQGSLFEGLPPADARSTEDVQAFELENGTRIAEYVASLQTSDKLGEQVVYHRVLPDADAQHAPNRRPWAKAVQDILTMQGIDELYSHQALATDMVRSGRHVVVATPTASGKSMVYNLPVIERFLQDRDAKALYLFPLKALAQDQLKTFQQMTSHWPKEARPDAAIYDGDTTQHFRKKIRMQPPTVLMTNPEMLHLSVLPHHEQWVEFLASLQYIVVDEVHTYRGVMGSHMAQVFRRLLRVCAQYGVRPTFIFCSATVGNPGELCRELTGLDVEVITESGAPQGKRHMLFLNPWESPSSAAIQLLKSALARGMRTIVYTQSRKMTELISMWVQEKSGKYKERISAYRAGFLPEERREIEAKMSSGELLAVISTSALELGIDIGALDLCILVGYPGTVMSTLQRGGRVGRAKQDSAVVLVAGEDALDQYFMRHPQDFFDRPAECAVLNPHNPVVLKRHLECAAAELTLRPHEPWLEDAAVTQAVHELEYEGLLLRDAEGTAIFAARKRPHRHVDLRGTGSTFHIQGPDGTIIGSVDGHKAFRETHPGAVYLHRGQTWTVTKLDIPTNTVEAAPGRVNYYTRVRGNKNTEILEVIDQQVVWGTRVCLGKLRVTESITGYEKRSVSGGKLLGIVPLDLPPLVFETEGIWFEVPLAVQRRVEDEFLHFMGSIHALEHAAIGILPLLVMTDRNDLGGISTPMHGQVGKPAVFIYDGMPGGAGLTRSAFAQAEQMFERTQTAIRDCECELGCPSCVHSPKCGSGNRPIDKIGAMFLLDALRSQPAAEVSPAKHDGGLATDLNDDLAQPFVLPTPSSAASQHHTSGGHPAPHSSPAASFDATSATTNSPAAFNAEGSSPASAAQHTRPEPPHRRLAKASHGDDYRFAEKLLATTSTSSTDNGPPAPFNLSAPSGKAAPHRESPSAPVPENPQSYCVVDVETQLSAQEVGGWHKADKMRVSIAVLYDSVEDTYIHYTEDRVPELTERLRTYDVVIGFNSVRFDYKVLSAYASYDLRTLPSLDLLQKVKVAVRRLF